MINSDFIITINEPGIQATFVNKIMCKFDDSRSIFVYVIRHTSRVL